MSSSLYADGIKALAGRCASPESLSQPDCQSSVDNPFCGDRIDLQLKVEGGRVTGIAQKVRGCMLCQASANVLIESAIGLTRDEIETVGEEMAAMLKGEQRDSWPPAGWESLALFEPVSRYKARHGCVTLPLTAALKALS